ncbi:hypothetical protein [Amycolatopsis speibonae]|uniref:DUF4062 domain-containing protein n=1 Tax=Amycolatopsis speibonae TaxID=1450224 RepID=A0ABV7P4M5_9PSEU
MTDQTPRVVCVCGSMRFYEAMFAVAQDEETAGRIVLLPYPADRSEEDLARHHRAKIDLADEVLVVNLGGYVGESAASEIAYATEAGKPVWYLFKEAARV